MRIVFILLACMVGREVCAQDIQSYLWKDPAFTNSKPVIDFDAIEHWERMGTSENDVAISPDGKYFSYVINNRPYQSRTLVVQAVNGNWKKEFIGAEPGVFSGDNKQYIVRTGDSLCLYSLDGETVNYVFPVSSYQTLLNDRWLAIQLKDQEQTLVLKDFHSGSEEYFRDVQSYLVDPGKEWLVCSNNDKLVLHHLDNGKKLEFTGVVDYTFSGNGKNLILHTIVDNRSALHWVKLPTGNRYTFFQAKSVGTTVTSFALGNPGNQLAFMLNKQSGNSVWYYKEGMVSAILKVDHNTNGIEGLGIDGPVSLTENGKYILFSLKPDQDNREADPDAADVNVWTYRDAELMSSQMLGERTTIKPYSALIGINDSYPRRISTDSLDAGIVDDYIIVRKNVKGDRFWEEEGKDSAWLASLTDDYKVFIKKSSLGRMTRDPSGRYLLYFDVEEGHYYSFDLQTRKKINISASCPIYLGSQLDADPSAKKNNYKTGLAEWPADEKSVLVYDMYDVWSLDLAGKKKPVCLTNSYGRKHNIRFRIHGNIDWEESTILLNALNLNNLDNCYFRIRLKSKTTDPELLSMGPYALNMDGELIPNNGNSVGGGMRPLKARDANIWIVRRQSASDAPNYYLTNDFRNYKKLTDLQPQKKYNWYTTELVKFKQNDGTKSQGVLYKPENFDPSRKYPALIMYYFQFSQLLHEFKDPYYCTSGIVDIPWFVSRGYLVFTPDIYFNSNRIRGASAVNTVEGAANHLASLSYVDGNKIGLAGHSRSGGYTNYIITHSKRFVAALEGAGSSNYVSSALQLMMVSNGTSRLFGAENEIFNGKTIWQLRDSSLRENPIMQVDKITVPLLIMHNQLDGSVLWTQAAELFVAMRRLNKKCWMIEYDKEGHLIVERKNQEDFSVRATQYFDHYLKGAPAPRWMTEGLPYNLKKIERRFELDLIGNCGMGCKICQEKKY